MNCYIPAEIGNLPLSEFRGPIKSTIPELIDAKSKQFFVVNELVSSSRVRTFSGTEVVFDSANKKMNVKDQVCIKFINRKFFEEKILERLNIRGPKIVEYYKNLQKSVRNYENTLKKVECVIKMIDIVVDDRGIYFVMEKFEETLAEYLVGIREPLKNYKYPIEIKFRPIIQSLLNGVITMHEKGLNFNAMLNPNEIQIKEIHGNSGERATVLVKLPNPLISRVLTLLELVPNEEDFSSNLPPEIYKAIKVAQENQKMHGNLSKWDVDWECVTPLMNQNFDKWTLGCLLYDLIFNVQPFIYKSFEEALKKIDNPKSKAYVVQPKKISDTCLCIIDECLRDEPRKRIQQVQLKKYYDKIVAENMNRDGLETMLKCRIETTTLKDSEIFYTYDYEGQIKKCDNNYD